MDNKVCMNPARYSEKLIRFGKKTITKEQMEKLFSETDDEALFLIVDALQQENILSPIEASKTNGNRVFPIFMKYRVSLPTVSFDVELDEIRRLHPVLQNHGILQSKPAEYAKYRRNIQLLDRYLFSRHADRIPISRKERSFEIFEEEKVLDDAVFCRLLERMGLGKQELAFYDTPEYCFNDYIPERKENMTLLICENKDIWFNIRRRMFENGANTIFSTRIDGVVYGCGNQISQKNALTSYTEFMGGARISYLYWGDIDRAGFNIFLSMMKNNPTLDITMFMPAYEQMLHCAKDKNIPDSLDNRGILGDYGDIYLAFSAEDRAFLQSSIQENKRIPQEIITYENLLYQMR